MLLTMGNAERTEPLTIIGPRGLEKVVGALRMIAPELPFPIQCIELSEADEYLEINGYHIHAFRVKHNVVCYGYSVEIKRAGKFSVEKAKEHEIPYQVEILVGIGTDAGEMQNAGKGVPTCGISIPSRTAHSAVEVIDLDDAENAKELLKAFVLTMKEKDEFKFVK